MTTIKSMWLPMLISIAALGGLDVTGAQGHLHDQTLNNLRTALREEAFTYVKYQLFAQHARDARRTEVAEVFARTADAERFQHLKEEAEQAGLVGDEVENLRDAISGETTAVEVMYKQFAEQARSGGDAEAAILFEQMQRYELAHLYTFKAVLGQLERARTSSSR